jgi:SET domain-containing protein
MKLISPTKVYVDKSIIAGRGVFASTDIPEGEILEQCHYVDITDQNFKVLSKPLDDYIFNRRGVFCIVLGYGMIYNHSKNPSAKYSYDVEKDCFTYTTIRKIDAGEEILVDYKKHTNF